MGCEASKEKTRPRPHPVDSMLRTDDGVPVSETPAEKELPPIYEAVPYDGKCCPKQKAYMGKVGLGSEGGMVLTHFPGKMLACKLRDLGCDVVVTLQKDEEGAQKVKALCGEFSMDWIQIDFWHLYHSGKSNELFAEVAKVSSLIRSGKHVAIHCAAGIHRTGMFAYSVLREIGYSSKAATDSLRHLREVTYLRVGRHRIQGVEKMVGGKPANEEDLPPATETKQK
eukprot:TRINITY_DN4688_c1_g1_i1.p1 TRINITY_DN4688_c1_g1~~TRINITY_DN4688_c1_g1_i1.p1  ORF type:complete len:226 (+),score=62.05 TRINITY_DN4688_c1_g1_i1:55-732(+)